MQRKPLTVISVKGDAYNRGHQYGFQAKDLIQKNVAYYLYLWKTYLKMDRNFVLEQSRKFIPAIERYDREIMEEMRGVANGAGVLLEEIVSLNARYEFVWAQMATKCAEGKECTAIATAPEVNSPEITLIGQNIDYKPKSLDLSVILEIEQEDRPNIVTYTEAGTVARVGLNSTGIGLCINALVSDRDEFEPAVPFLVLCRGILNGKSLSDAIGAVMSAERSVSGNFLIAHSTGEIIDLEITPHEVGFMYPDDGIIAHTNHFIDLRMKVTDKFIAVIPDTLLRVARARKLLSLKRGKIDVETFKQIFRDHFNRPNSICRHRDPRLHLDLQLESVASLIMNLNTKTLHISNGPPCENEHNELVFKSLVEKA